MSKFKLVIGLALSFVGFASNAQTQNAEPLVVANTQDEIDNLELVANNLVSKLTTLGLYDKENAALYVEQLTSDQIIKLNKVLKAEIHYKSAPVNLVF